MNPSDQLAVHFSRCLWHLTACLVNSHLPRQGDDIEKSQKEMDDLEDEALRHEQDIKKAEEKVTSCKVLGTKL